MEENETCFKEIPYEVWLKSMEEIIRKQISELKYYVRKYFEKPLIIDKRIIPDFYEKIKERYYSNKIKITLENIIENIDLVKTISKRKDQYIFCVDRYYTPLAIFVGKSLKKYFKRDYYVNI